ncbi:MAG: xanthine dehydrogenase family protein subunit M [Acidobacteria bacterium]|nr:xanthine dehydrogenase family protein subunit M [Acidobacteriota bacterium]
MKWFDYKAPTTLAGTLADLNGHPGAYLLAGGTDLLVQLRAGRKETDLVIDIKRVPELNEISFDPSTGLTLGAAVNWADIQEHPDVKRHYPSLAEVSSIIGGTQIQGRASLGGNLCNAAPSADSIPLLIALGARCRIASVNGEREIAVEDVCIAPGKNSLKPGDLLVSVHFPAPKPSSGAQYLRFIPRNEMDIAVAGAGASVVLNNGIFAEARIALASVAPTPLFVQAAGDSLKGKPVNEESIEAAAEIAKQAAQPISDMRGTAEYRRHLCAVLTRRALQAAVKQAKELQ